MTAFGCTEIFKEHVSAVQHRDELERALKFIRKGDQFVCSTLSRLARSVPDLLRIIQEIENKGASLIIRDMGVDTSTPIGRLLCSVVGAISQFEREIMKDRQKSGIARAKELGRYRGRKPTARNKSTEVMDLHSSGVGAAEVALRLGISRASVYRIIASCSQSADNQTSGDQAAAA